MSSKESIKEEFQKAREELNKIQQGNSSKEVIDAIIEKIKEEEVSDEKVAKPVESEETHIN